MQDGTFVIAATGPSFTLSQARMIGMAKAIHGTKMTVIAVNDAVYPLWSADMAYACDAQWWRHHKGLPGFKGWKVRLHHPDPLSGRDRNALAMDDVDTYTSSGESGFDPRPGFIRTGGSSGYQAIHIAVHQRAQRIILVGFDMSDHAHWFGDHPAAVRRSASMKRWIQEFGKLSSILRGFGVAVSNCSPGTALKCFPRHELEDQLELRDRL